MLTRSYKTCTISSVAKVEKCHIGVLIPFLSFPLRALNLPHDSSRGNTRTYGSILVKRIKGGTERKIQLILRKK